MTKGFTIQEKQWMFDIAKKREFEDFRDCLDYLSKKCSKREDLPRLRSENECLTSDKNSEITIDQAKEKIHELKMNVKELQMSNTDKDNTIATLRTQLTKCESDSARKSEEISRLSTELEHALKESGSSVTPVLCRRTAGKAKLRGTSHRTAQKNKIVMEESQSSQVIEKARSSRKRKASGCISGERVLEPASTSANKDIKHEFEFTIKPYIYKNPVLHLPEHIVKAGDLKKKKKMTLLYDEDQRQWPVELKPMSRAFGIKKEGWRPFMEANALKVGDTYKLELIDCGTKPKAIVKYFGKRVQIKHQRMQRRK